MSASLSRENIAELMPDNNDNLRAPVDPYIYEAIQANQIRLCRFVQDGAILSAVLESFPTVLDLSPTVPKYIALSYTWKTDQQDSNDSWPLQIEDQQFFVLGSLKPFVQALRAKGTLLDGTWWWIDSICIDQKNHKEKSQQVPRMTQIYRDAHEVIVWLGPQSDDSDRALDFIGFLNRLDKVKFGKKTLRKKLHQDRHLKDWIAYENFFLRRWWTRIWTLQEFVIPSIVSFWCGSKQNTRRSLFSAIIVAYRCKIFENRLSVALHHAFHRRRAWLLYESVRESKNFITLPLTTLAAYFCSNEASDDRDRIYGLAGLCTEDHHLEINYAWTVEEVYLRFAKSFITTHRSLDIIPFASLFVASPDSSLPSWVPDWRTTVKPFVVPLMVSQSSSDYVGNLRPYRYFKSRKKTTS
jgi:hypothetical protein